MNSCNFSACFRFLFWLACLAFIGGCATEPRQFVLKGQESANAQHLTWPPIGEGDIPRYHYLGELVGDPNFVTKKSDVAAVRVMSAIWGVITGRAEPKEISRPQSGIVDATGRILVTDFNRRSVVVFDEKAGQLQEWTNATAGLRFVAPVAIANGEQGQFFVTDADLGFVARLDAAGKPLEPLGLGHLSRPTGVAYEATTKRLFVADTQGHHIKVFGLDGQLLDVWGEQGEEVDRPKEKRADDDLLLSWPTYLAVARGKLYISDTMNARVVVVSSATGRQLTTIGTRGTFVGNLVRPKGVAVDSEDNVYVIEGYHDHLLVFDRKGRFLMAIGGEGEAPGKFQLPGGVWIDGRDRIFVSDTHNSRVQIFQFLEGGSENAE